MRQRYRRLTALAAAGLTAVAASACNAGPRKTFEDEATVSTKITSVRLANDSGGVTLRGDPEAEGVELHRVVKHRGERPGTTHKVEDGVLVLGGCGDSCEVNYTVGLPEGIPVTGGTSSGAVKLFAVGEVDVRTTNGAVDIDGAEGPVRARTSNGRIEARGLEGGSVTAETTNGAIQLTPATAQDVTAKTSNGRIELTVPKSSYQVSAATSNGGKDIDVSHDPAGQHALDLTTSNGSIAVRSR